MLNEILCGESFMTVMRYNETCAEFLHLRSPTDDDLDDEHSFRRVRRASHEALSKTRVTEFYSLHAKEAARLIDGILENPNTWDIEFYRWV